MKRIPPTNRVLHGVLNVNKPAGMTSHDVVDEIRRSCKMKKVGHAGTLDPMATGVLPLCIGNGTRIQQFLVAQDKVYLVDATLGLMTDSQDTTGKEIERKPVPDDLTEESMRELLAGFVGQQEQIPPMVSAKHHKGKRLYELARKGLEVKRDPITIHIFDIELIEFDLPTARFRVSCSKGTYVRTLCHDIGKQLGCGGCMSGLVRERAGAFCIGESAVLEDLKDTDMVRERMVSLNDALSNLPEVTVNREGQGHLRHGRSLLSGMIGLVEGAFSKGQMLRVSTPNGRLLAIGEALFDSGQIADLGGNLMAVKPVKVLS